MLCFAMLCAMLCYAAPQVKFVLHNASAIAYTLLYTIILCGWPWQAADWMWHSGRIDSQHLPAAEVFAWAWTGTRCLEELIQVAQTGSDYLDSCWNLLDVVTYGMIFGAAGCRIALVLDGRRGVWLWSGAEGAEGLDFATRITLSNICQCLYALSLTAMYIRFIDALKLVEKVGVLSITLGKMFVDVGTWCAMLCCYAMLCACRCYAMPCHAMPCHAMPC